MPNWCIQKFTVRGEAAEIQRFRETMRGVDEGDGDPSEFSFNGVIPMPASLRVEDSTNGDMGMAAITGNGFEGYRHFVRDGTTVNTRDQFFDWMKATNPKGLELGLTYLDNIKNYGAKTWYDWSVENWGTKWDAGDVSLTEEEDGSLTIRMQTAWSFPEVIFKKIGELFPTLSIEGEADEEGGYFWGSFAVKDGELTTDFQSGTRPGGPFDYGDDDDEDGGPEEGEDAGEVK